MTGSARFHIRQASTLAEITAVAALFRAYAASLSVDLAYQDFETELAGLPGKYAPPRGALLLASGDDGGALGCVALRPTDEAGAAEMKRLYVAPQGRGRGLGEAMIRAVCDAARLAGYAEIRLDTLPDMAGAQALYRKLGFTDMPAYYDTPVVGTRFMHLRLGNA
ncbi:GNAT family N-acetyltransferase [Alsobacter sp. R-9]